MPTLVEVADSSLIAKALSARVPNLPDLAKQAEGDPELLLAAIDALGSVSPRVRFAACKLLRMVSEEFPEALYPHFDSFVRLLHDKNSILRWNAILALGNLAAVDHQDKLDPILDDYLAPISGPNLIDAANAMKGAAAIARAKPLLADRIAHAILAVELARYGTRECHNVAIGHAISALSEFFPSLRNRHEILSLVRRQLKNPRRATSNKARKFLAKWPATLGQTGACEPCELCDS
jgi:HEAT-like repeat protein